jgi:hypothetical protein
VEATPAVNRLDRGTLLALVAMGLGVFVIANDFTALSVAIPLAGGLILGIRLAFRVDAALAVVGLLVSLAYIGRTEAVTHRPLLRWHRAHA